MLRKGFTLIELLLVIAIIGILAAIVLAGVASTRSKARDAARLMDLRSIASVLEFFYTDKGHYPVAEGWVTGATRRAPTGYRMAPTTLGTASTSRPCRATRRRNAAKASVPTRTRATVRFISSPPSSKTRLLPPQQAR